MRSSSSRSDGLVDSDRAPSSEVASAPAAASSSRALPPISAREFRRALLMQRALLPRHSSVLGFDIAVGFEPAHGLSGDVVSVVPLADGRLLCALADVSGRGTFAAIVGAMVHAALAAFAQTLRPITAVLADTNTFLASELPDEVFVTVTAALLDARSGDFEIVNAGQPAPILVRPHSAPERLIVPGQPPLGLAAFDLSSLSTSLERGSGLLLATDGLTELRGRDGTMIGEEGLLATVGTVLAAHPADEALPTLAAHLSDLLERQRNVTLRADDRTFLWVRRA